MPVVLRINYREVRTELGRSIRRLLQFFIQETIGGGQLYHNTGGEIWSDLEKSLIF